MHKRWRHVKRGTEYSVEVLIDPGDLSFVEGDDLVFRDSNEEIAYAEVQSSNPEGTRGKLMVVYYGSDGYRWARACDEFIDGRFEKID